MNDERRVIASCVARALASVVFPPRGQSSVFPKDLSITNSLLQQAHEAWLKMTEKKQSRKTAPANGYEVRWVNRNLTEQEKTEHDTRPVDLSRIGKDWIKIALQGYSTKLSWDAYSKCFQATLTAWDGNCPNYGYGLSARGSTPERAISLLLYKHYEVLQENWTEAYQPRPTDFEG